MTEEDLQKTFSNLGSIDAVEIIRTKGRSFAYIDFLPSSDNSLPKLLSTYNGCMWKGGKLKLEKAKEHYIDRLKREQMEDAEAINSAQTNHVDGDEDMDASPKLKSSHDSEKEQIRIFFPKLRKFKSLPFCGTGKHKYSFQRVEARPLPLHFCDCPEHSDPVETPKETRVRNSVINRRFNRDSCPGFERLQLSKEARLQDSKIQDEGMNEEEISIMNSVMKKLLDRKTSKMETKKLQDSPKQDVPTSDFPVDTNEIEDETDDDDIKINVDSGQNNGLFSENCELQTSFVNEMAGSNEQSSYDDISTQSNHQIQDKKDKASGRKRIPLASENNEKDRAFPVSKKKVRFQPIESEEHMENPNIVTEARTKKSSTQKGVWSQKSAWKELVGNGISSSFSLSHITTTPGSKLASEEYEGHERVDNVVHENPDGEPSEPRGKEVVLAADPGGPSVGLDNPIKGSSWLQKSSWTQLVGSGNSSSFSISQILPEDMLEKRDMKKPNAFSTMKEPGTGETTAFGDPRGSKYGFAASSKKRDAKVSTPSNISGATINKKFDSEQKKQSSSRSLPGDEGGNSCTFMRSNDSLKDWMSAKTALSSALKKRNNNK